jgi:hypothetical protein
LTGPGGVQAWKIVGEAAEFDTLVLHWFGSTRHSSAEVLSMFDRSGDRMLVRAPAGDRETHPGPHQDHP